MIKFHFMLDWVADGKRGSAQFDAPYFMFQPKRGGWTSEEWTQYRTDDEAIAQIGRDFDQITRTGTIVFPVPARETEAVWALQNAREGGRTVNLAMGLLQYDDSGRTKPVRGASASPTQKWTASTRVPTT